MKQLIKPIFHVSREEIKKENLQSDGPSKGNDVDSDLMEDSMEEDDQE